jgi:hypothetical protein
MNNLELIQNAYRDSRSYSIGPNSSLDLDITGTAIKHLRGDGNIEISFNNKPETDFAVGMGYPHGSIAPYSKITLINHSDHHVEGVFSYGSGNVDNDSLVIADAIKIRNENGTILKVDDDATQSLLTTVDTTLKSVLALLQSNQDQRAGLTTLENASYASVSGSSSTVVSESQNINGVIIRLGSSNSYTKSYTSGILVSDNLITVPYYSGGGGNVYRSEVKNIFVPPGCSIKLMSNRSNYIARIWYEVL